MKKKISKKIETFEDAAEMLWIVLANVSEGDWTKQSKEWQEAAARWRDAYFDVKKSQPLTDRCPKCNNLWIIHDCPIISGGANPQPPTDEGCKEHGRFENFTENENKCPACEYNKPTDEGWEKEFDEKFPDDFFDKRINRVVYENGIEEMTTAKRYVKDFIRKLLSERTKELCKDLDNDQIIISTIRAETIKEIENIMNNMFHNKEANNNAYEFFQQIKVKINKLKSQTKN